MNPQSTAPHHPDIAVIGMAAELPGADDLDAFWENIRAGEESITHGSPRVVEDPATGRRRVHARGVLKDVRRFDAEFFGIPRREAEVLDPQHRRLLELSWNAMEDAGYDPYRVRESVAVYTSVGPNTYYGTRDFGARSAAERMLIQLSNGPDTLPTRISYKLGLTGESVNVQSACSSAAVAVHLACEALRAGRADMALVGAASISALETLAYEHQDGFILSADGSTRAYDKGASGYVEGDGAGVLVLRRLEDALERRDNVHAVIKSSAVNNDGRAKAGYSAPSVAGQSQVISAALEASGVPADTIAMVEGHGTGTQVGDPIEVRGLARAYRAFTDRTDYCALGSVKANIGHLCFASGIAGLLKAVLCLKHGELPPMAVLEEVNPDIDFTDTPFYLNRTVEPWPQPGPRRAGVSCFGMGGTNAHFILEQAPDPAAGSEGSGPGRTLPVVLSARSDEALAEAKRRLATHLRAHPDTDLVALAHTLATGRRPLAHRWAVSADSTDALLRALDGAPPAPDGSRAAELARTWAEGGDANWDEVFDAADRRRVSLPGYPWQGERLWIEAAPADAEGAVELEAQEQAPVTEWLHRPAWERTALPRPYLTGDLPPVDGVTLLLGDGDGGPADELAAELTAAGRTVLHVAPGGRFEVTDDHHAVVRPTVAEDFRQLVDWAVARGGSVAEAVHLWAYGAPADQDTGIARGALAVLHLVQALAAARQSADLWIGTENAQTAAAPRAAATASGEAHRTLRLEASAVLGLCRVVPQEHPELRCHAVDFALDTPPAQAAAGLLAEMASPSGDPEVVYRGGDRLLPTVEQLPAPDGGPVPVPVRPGGVYLVTGGLGRIGLVMAELFARTAPVRLALVSRTPDADAPGVRRLRDLGAEVLVLGADVADETAMRSVVDVVHARWGAIDGVVHSAGIEESRNFSFIADTGTERALAALRPKVPGVAVLDRVTRDEPLEFCLVCSSLDTLLGGIAFGVHSVANRYLDSYAHRRRAQGAPWVSVDWDSWRFDENGSGRIGAAAARTAIRPGQAADVLGAVLTSGEAQCVVSTVPLADRIERIRRAFERRRQDAAAREGTPGALTREEIGSLVRDVVGEITDTPGPRDEDELLAVGCDSLALLEVVVRLEGALRLKLPMADLWGCSTLADLADVCRASAGAQRTDDGDGAEEALRYLAG
ncbi:SDR family NAD(P)-dependent oxidoreductase [Streptomyces sp. HUAS TT20]|uniref:SDR family NAD(P)-dependent oxidoreductase n=1 Tax=Streptomyces sp. HUAS TT20 TaxID=3447509 RepID=UPI0021D97AEE|nr:SDR family NAD(P)-dependent oxidoreductase [Streptomyces sp. HUAS 15-9]UXY30492.1 SDR family NAD(P)-dependent oxidoreductase [Streptomyces sp. HUAS 15-9]